MRLLHAVIVVLYFFPCWYSSRKLKNVSKNKKKQPMSGVSADGFAA